MTSKSHPVWKPVKGTDGTIYPSRAAAARALGVHASTIEYHLDQYGDLSMLGTWCVPVAKGKHRWPSIVAACRALKITHGQVRQHLRKYGNLDRVGAHGGRRWSKPLRIGPIEWPAMCDAQRDLGIARPTLREWISPNASPVQRERLMAAVMQVQAKRENAKHRSEA